VLGIREVNFLGFIDGDHDPHRHGAALAHSMAGGVMPRIADVNLSQIKAVAGGATQSDMGISGILSRFQSGQWRAEAGSGSV
jgi:hypothetical protein